MARSTVILLTATVGAVSGCGGDDDTGASSDDTSLPPLAATTTIWADISSHVACGEEVVAIIPAGADPHAFEPSLRDRELLDRAGVVVANGSQLEESLGDLLATVAEEGVDVVEITPHVDLIDDDPHIWQDPIRVAGALDVIESAVVASGRDAAEIGLCADAYRAELEALDAAISDQLAGIPPERRLLVTNHDAFAYFADRYDFEIVGTVIPSASTLGESSAGQLAVLADVIAEHDVPAIFAERLGSATDAEALANRIGVAVVELDSDSLAPDGPASSYTGMLAANAAAIADALV